MTRAEYMKLGIELPLCRMCNERCDTPYTTYCANCRPNVLAKFLHKLPGPEEETHSNDRTIDTYRPWLLYRRSQLAERTPAMKDYLKLDCAAVDRLVHATDLFDTTPTIRRAFVAHLTECATCEAYIEKLAAGMPPNPQVYQALKTLVAQDFNMPTDPEPETGDA